MKLRISRGAMRAPLVAVTCLLGLVISSAGAGAQSYASGLDAVDEGRVDEAVAIWEAIIADDGPDRAQAEYALALLYETGRAVPWDEARAAALYAASGLPEALTNLGLMYAEGRGVDFDPAKAAELWQQAADQGHAFASFNLGLAYYAGDGVPRNPVTALALIYEAGEGGLAEAQWAVCQFYERGVGVEASPSTALDWCQRAAEQGHRQAGETVARLQAASSPEGLAQAGADREALSASNADDVDLSAETDPSGPDGRATDLLTRDLDSRDLASADAAAALAPGPEAGGASDADAAAKDPALEFMTQSPPTEPSTPATDAPETPTEAREAPAQDALATDPMLLLGSEFEEFADLLAPLDKTGEETGPETNKDTTRETSAETGAETAAVSDPGDPATLPLSPEADEIAALIESAATLNQDLEALSDLPELNIDDGTRPPLPAGRPTPDFAIPALTEDQPAFALWLGTGQDAAEARRIHDDALAVAPEVLGLMEATYQNDKLPPSDTGGSTTSQPIVRLLFGPLPGQGYAWQICNLLRAREQRLFCLPVAVEGS